MSVWDVAKHPFPGVLETSSQREYCSYWPTIYIYILFFFLFIFFLVVGNNPSVEHPTVTQPTVVNVKVSTPEPMGKATTAKRPEEPTGRSEKQQFAERV